MTQPASASTTPAPTDTTPTVPPPAPTPPAKMSNGTHFYVPMSGLQGTCAQAKTGK